MKRKYYFYVLKDPITLEIRYLGKTVNPKKRLSDHMREANSDCSTHKCCWIRSLNAVPVMQIVYETDCTIEQSYNIEKILLRKFAKKFRLTNSEDNSVGAYKTGKLVYQYDLQGNYIRTFQNANHASIETGIFDSNILRACKKSDGKGYNRAGSYLWLHKRYTKYPYPLYSRKKETKKVEQYSMSNEFIREYNSAKEASNITGINYKMIWRVCQGDRPLTHNFKFRFK